MNPRALSPAARRFSASAALLVLAVLAASPAPAAVRSRRPAPAADSGAFESAPGKLIVPPAAIRDTAVMDRALPPTPADTARAGRLKRAREQFGQGLILEEQHAFAAAIVSYHKAALTDPDLRGPAYRIGLLYASRQQFRPAARSFREELRRNPGDRAATTEYALALVELGDTTRAVRMLEELTRRAPGDASVWRALGFAYGRAGRDEDAERALRGAVGLDPKLARGWRDLGVVLAARGKDAGAREAYRHALSADPDDETTLINLGNLEARTGNHAAALADYREAERRDSTQAWAYRGQVRELVMLHREGDAGAVWRRWLKVAPLDPEVREGAARHFVHVGRSDIGLEIAREGVRLAPTSGEAWWLLGEMRAAAPDARGALAAYREAEKQFQAPDDRARAEAGIAALRAGAADSLRALFAADSAASAARDTTRRSRR